MQMAVLACSSLCLGSGVRQGYRAPNTVNTVLLSRGLSSQMPFWVQSRETAVASGLSLDVTDLRYLQRTLTAGGQCIDTSNYFEASRAAFTAKPLLFCRCSTPSNRRGLAPSAVSVSSSPSRSFTGLSQVPALFLLFLPTPPVFHLPPPFVPSPSALCTLARPFYCCETWGNRALDPAVDRV